MLYWIYLCKTVHVEKNEPTGVSYRHEYCSLETVPKQDKAGPFKPIGRWILGVLYNLNLALDIGGYVVRFEWRHYNFTDITLHSGSKLLKPAGNKFTWKTWFHEFLPSKFQQSHYFRFQSLCMLHIQKSSNCYVQQYGTSIWRIFQS